jgi:hypothetical protein
VSKVEGAGTRCWRPLYSIVLANAATLGARHIKITTAAQAARALAPIVGRFDTV